MNIRWRLNKRELHILMQMMRGKDAPDSKNDSVEDNLTEEELSAMAEKWKQGGYLVPTGGSWRLEEGLQLAISTMIDPRSSFSCSRMSGVEMEKKTIFFHGQTIILMEDNGTEEVGLLWIPFLPLAIGAVSELFCVEENDVSDSNVKIGAELAVECLSPQGMAEPAIFHIEGHCGEETVYQKTVRWEGDGFVVAGDGSDNTLYSKVEVVHEVTDWLAAVHKKCMEEVLRFE
ncbi:MAG: hypothetical protein LIO96_03905 [Lachnospiraceae bacterium]|nr:hypothetical protein [Lachnospiraceae bacterium]